MENYFELQLDNLFKEINTMLVRSFSNVFGEKNKDKFIKIIDEVDLAFLGKNLSKNLKKEKLDYYGNKLEKLSKDYIILEDKYGNKFIPKGKIADEIYLDLFMLCYQYNYYLTLMSEKDSDSKKNITLYIKNSKMVTAEFLNFIYEFKEINSNITGVAYFYKRNFQIALRSKDSIKINLRCYIHELIHCFMYELLALIEERKIMTDGAISLCSKHETVNEIIVEYLTLMVLEDVVKNNNLSEDVVDIEFDKSKYLKVDELFNYLIKRVFLLLDSVIFDDIFNGGRDRLIKIIGVDNLKKVEKFMDKVMNEKLEKSIYEDDVCFSPEELSEMKFFGDMMYTEIKKSYEKYFDICHAENEYVANLVEQGLVRRV